MNIRHDLSSHGVVGHVVRENDDLGAVVALTISDPVADVQIGIRIHSLEQARALREAAQAAEKALQEEIEALEAVGTPECVQEAATRVLRTIRPEARV